MSTHSKIDLGYLFLRAMNMEMVSDWTLRQRQLRNVAFATLSALAIDLTLINSRSDLSGLLQLFLVGVGVFLVGSVAMTALVLLAVDRLKP